MVIRQNLYALSILTVRTAPPTLIVVIARWLLLATQTPAESAATVRAVSAAVTSQPQGGWRGDCSSAHEAAPLPRLSLAAATGRVTLGPNKRAAPAVVTHAAAVAAAMTPRVTQGVCCV